MIKLVSKVILNVHKLMVYEGKICIMSDSVVSYHQQQQAGQCFDGIFPSHFVPTAQEATICLWLIEHSSSLFSNFASVLTIQNQSATFASQTSGGCECRADL